MCYTIEINLTREQLERRFKASFEKNAPYRKSRRVNAFSLPEVPVIAAEEPGKINLFTWGLIPFWVKDEHAAGSIRLKTFNARADTITEKPSYKHALKRRRCLVLTNGFYEWHHEGKQKIPYYIRKKHEEELALAGLYERWTNKYTGEILRTFTIITTEANPLMATIHNTKKRMPVMLSEEDEDYWINPEIEPEEAITLLKPFDQEMMVAEKTDRDLFRKERPADNQDNLFN